MEGDKQNFKHGLGLDLLSSKAAFSFNSFLRQQRPNDTTERTAQQPKHEPAEKFARRKERRNAPKAVGGLGLRHIESSWENAGSPLRSHGSITSPITQRKKANKKARPVHNAGTPRIQVDTNIQVKQSNVPLQVFPSHSDDITKHDGEQNSSQAYSQRMDPSTSQNRLSAVTSNTPRGKISWWLKGTSQPDEGLSAATASPSPMSTLRLAGISPSDGPIPIGIDQDTLVSLNTQRTSYRSNITESTPTIMVTPAREKEMMISRWSPSSPGSTAIPASMARLSSVYSSMNGLCQPTAVGGYVPPVPALPNHAIQNNALIQNNSHFNYPTREMITSDPFTSPRVIKRTQTNESESTIIEEDETPPADEAVDRAWELTKPPQKSQSPTTDYSQSRPDLTIETTVPTPRRSHGWWNIITTPFEFLNSSAKDRKSVPAMPFANTNATANKAHTTPEITKPSMATDPTFPSPTLTSSSVDQHPEAHIPIAQKQKSSTDGMARTGLVRHPSPLVSQVPPYQRSESNFSQHQHQYQQNVVEPITVNVTHIDQRTYHSYGIGTPDVEKGSINTSVPQERYMKSTTNRSEFSTTTTEKVHRQEGFNPQNIADRTFESPRTVPAPQRGFPERQGDRLREKLRGRSRRSYRAESRERSRDISKENYKEKDIEMSRERSRDRSRGWLTDRSRDTSRNKSRYSSADRSNNRSSESFSEKQRDRYRRDDSPASKKYSFKISGNPRGLFPSDTSDQPSTIPYNQSSGGGTGNGMPLPVPAATPGSFGEALRSWLPRNFSPRNLSLRKKPGRCIIFSIIIGFIIILIAILVPVMTLNQDDDGNGGNGAEDSDALWLNVTGFPSVPSGITTVAKTNAVVQKSGCVFPTTLWSCALPKEKHSSDDSFEPDEPTFRIKIGSRNESISDEIESLPPPPSLEDQMFLGNTTDRNEEPFEGEKTPFFISLLPPEDEESLKRKVKRQLLDDDGDADNDEDEGDDGDNSDDEDNDEEEDDDEEEEEDEEEEDEEDDEDGDDEEDDDDGDVPDLTAIIPSPSIGRDGKAAPANLLVFPKEQPLRLYNRGLEDEYYGFYIYYDRSIFLQSIAALNGSDSERISQDEEDRDGGAALEDASFRCTWAQTRLLVQIWTRRDGKRLLPGNDDADEDDDDDDSEGQDNEKEQSSVENLLEAGIFPYPVTLTLDRHGGSIQDKMLYCYGVDDEGEIITTERKFELENRAFEGRLVNPAQGPFGNVTVDIDEGGPGGIDGGTGGCSCEYVNWMEQ